LAVRKTAHCFSTPCTPASGGQNEEFFRQRGIKKNISAGGGQNEEYFRQRGRKKKNIRQRGTL